MDDGGGEEGRLMSGRNMVWGVGLWKLEDGERDEKNG